MADSALRKFISLLETNGELSHIQVCVDPVLEIAAITNQISKKAGGGRALLFEQPAGSNFPVATNIFGSKQRVCLALGLENINELTTRLNALLGLIAEIIPEQLDCQLAALPELNRFKPTASSEPDPDMIEMSPADLDRFPFLQSWPEDGAAAGKPRYITLPQIFTTDPDGNTENCGMYRVQLRSKNEVAIQWKNGSGAARHAEQYHNIGQRMPVAIVLGGDPATLFSAMFPLPGNLDEITFAGFLRGNQIKTAPCLTVPLQVPTEVEIVIEGYVAPGATAIEGPFGNHTGYYASVAPAALMRVTSIRHRHDAIIPATVVGMPPMEDCWMAMAWERLLLGFLQKMVPAIMDIHFPFEWIFHQSAIISLENPQPGMVRNISDQLWRLPWFSSAQLLVFVAATPEVVNLSFAAWRMINVTDYSSDIIHDKATGRVALDATGINKQHPVINSGEVNEVVARRWREYGLA